MNAHIHLTLVPGQDVLRLNLGRDIGYFVVLLRSTSLLLGKK